MSQIHPSRHASSREKTGIIFFGSDSISVPYLEQLAGDGWPILGVVTLPPAPRDRGLKLQENIVVTSAKKLNLPVFTPQKSQEIIALIEKVKPEMAIVVAYGKILPQGALDLATRGFVNVHPSLLPHWRGPSPIQSALLAGDQKTGVSFILLDDKMDHGPLMAQFDCEIGALETALTLEKKLIDIGCRNLSPILDNYLARNIIPRAQDHGEATYCKKFQRTDGFLDSTYVADVLERRVRALAGWPGTYLELNSQRLKVHKAHASQTKPKENELGIPCANGSWLVLEWVQPEGKRPMSGSAYLAGHRLRQ